jgi:PAS domain S-box-containing protein
MPVLRILSLEDDPNDADLIREQLEAENIASKVTRVETEAAFRAALEQAEVDIILADYSLPSFDGITALKVAMKMLPDVPFIFVSGTLGEEVAIEALKIGATDYILKTRLARLAPSVLRAQREARERAERKQAGEELRRSQAYLAEAQKLSRTGSFGWNVSTGAVYWSDETFRIFEYEPHSRVTIERIVQRTHPEDRTSHQEYLVRVAQEKTELDFEHRLLMPDGSVKYLRVVGRPSKDEAGDLEFVGAVSDVTAEKVAEQRHQGDQRQIRRIIDAMPQLIVALTPDGRTLYINQAVADYTGRQPEEIRGNDFLARVFHPEDVARITHERQQALARGAPFKLEMRARRKDGMYRWLEVLYKPLLGENGEVLRWYASATDIDDRKQAEEHVRNENIALREEIGRSSMFEEIVGESPALQAVLAHVVKVAPTESTVLITGETGTGKELIARAIHKRSQRSAGVFVSVSCAAIPASLIASELFGHEKGAFTGAIQRHLGRFELAEGGTIFLDEIGELPPDIQITLLRILQEREFERVGGCKVIRANVRVIAATNRNLPAAIDGGTFRKDLYYRLNVFPIEMPPLRERREDIPVLVEHFTDRFASKAGKRIRGISKGTLERLTAYSWPGNIRELQNVIERSVVICERETLSIDENWLSSRLQKSSEVDRTVTLRVTASEEKQAIETALARCRGRIAGPSGAAAQLGVPASTLDSKIKALKINKHRFKAV